MPAPDIACRQFGFEAEFHRPGINEAMRLLRNAGFYTSRENQPGRGTQGSWHVKPDMSVRGAEIASPVLDISNAEHRNLVTSMCKTISTGANAVVIDGRCGLHVHVDVSDLGVTEICNAVATYYSHQRAIERLVGRRCTRMHSRSISFTNLETIYSTLVNRHPNRSNHSHHAFIGRDDVQPRGAGCPGWESCPRTAVNVGSFPRLGTIEFRQHYMTLDPKMLLAWIGLVCGIVNAAKAGQGSWNRNSNGSRKRLLELVDDDTARYYTNWRPTRLPAFIR